MAIPQMKAEAKAQLDATNTAFGGVEATLKAQKVAKESGITDSVVSALLGDKAVK